MKRLFPLLLVLLLIPCLIVPASAASTDTILENIYDNVVDIWIQNDIWYETFGGWLSDIVDRLDWIDQEVSSIETSVLKILQEIYTQGTLTIGECVKGIRSYVVSIAGYLETGYDLTIGQVVYRISEFVADIGTKFDTLLEGTVDNAGSVVGDSLMQNENLDNMGSIIETAPSIDQGNIDSSIRDVNGKFQNITSDADGTLLFGALGQIAGSNIFSQLLPTTAMLGVLSFALFGRVF